MTRDDLTEGLVCLADVIPSSARKGKAGKREEDGGRAKTVRRVCIAVFCGRRGFLQERHPLTQTSTLMFCFSSPNNLHLFFFLNPSAITMPLMDIWILNQQALFFLEAQVDQLNSGLISPTLSVHGCMIIGRCVGVFKVQMRR